MLYKIIATYNNKQNYFFYVPEELNDPETLKKIGMALSKMHPKQFLPFVYKIVNTDPTHVGLTLVPANTENSQIYLNIAIAEAAYLDPTDPDKVNLDAITITKQELQTSMPKEFRLLPGISFFDNDLEDESGDLLDYRSESRLIDMGEPPEDKDLIERMVEINNFDSQIKALLKRIRKLKTIIENNKNSVPNDTEIWHDHEGVLDVFAATVIHKKARKHTYPLEPIDATSFFHEDPQKNELTKQLVALAKIFRNLMQIEKNIKFKIQQARYHVTNALQLAVLDYFFEVYANNKQHETTKIIEKFLDQLADRNKFPAILDEMSLAAESKLSNEPQKPDDVINFSFRYIADKLEVIAKFANQLLSFIPKPEPVDTTKPANTFADKAKAFWSELTNDKPQPIKAASAITPLKSLLTSRLRSLPPHYQVYFSLSDQFMWDPALVHLTDSPATRGNTPFEENILDLSHKCHAFNIKIEEAKEELTSIESLINAAYESTMEKKKLLDQFAEIKSFAETILEEINSDILEQNNEYSAILLETQTIGDIIKSITLPSEDSDCKFDHEKLAIATTIFEYRDSLPALLESAKSQLAEINIESILAAEYATKVKRAKNIPAMTQIHDNLIAEQATFATKTKNFSDTVGKIRTIIEKIKVEKTAYDKTDNEQKEHNRLLQIESSQKLLVISAAKKIAASIYDPLDWHSAVRLKFFRGGKTIMGLKNTPLKTPDNKDCVNPTNVHQLRELLNNYDLNDYNQAKQFIAAAKEIRAAAKNRRTLHFNLFCVTYNSRDSRTDNLLDLINDINCDAIQPITDLVMKNINVNWQKNIDALSIRSIESTNLREEESQSLIEGSISISIR